MVKGSRGETAPPFCCAQRQQLYEMLVKQRCLFQKKLVPSTSTSTSLQNKSARELQDLLPHIREMEDYSQFNLELPSKLGLQSVSIPVAEMSSSESKVLRFRLSCAKEKELYPTSTSESLQTEDTQVLIPVCDHSPCQFGICHHQGLAKPLQKFYSNGMKFLTVLPDGSAQVFYPSGLLAVIVVITEENGRVCIVYDDSNAPAQPIRALFQCDGRATCYHSNGNIWLSLNRSGGQCLDEMGARVRRWCWSNVGQTSTSLHPVFLSINKTVGVRVLGREQVFVSFLAKGQQAKFSVGTCCSQKYSKTDQPASGPPISKEELFVSASRIRFNLAIQRLHQYLVTPSHPQLSKAIHASHLHVVSKRLLEDSTRVVMSDSERAYIQNCLQGCL
ncbi:glutamate-rich protein 6 [Mastacembelus armatus]|uniref:glutamate-rich protein 6 n=1 Tax=Mastacembelus armatus TaxID=205130 RepID=UPI000E4630EF|nr:glutamate-rich protein 6 [Mastacembelus armatus]